MVDMLNFDNLFQKENIFVIVGASNNIEKYGSKVFLDLKHAGYNVIAINNSQSEVHDTPAYPTITKFLDRIEHLFNEKKRLETLNKIILVMVVPPNAAFEVLKEAHLHNVNKVWFQPGSESKEAINFCKEYNIQAIHNQCIMIQKP